jgi:hypothetical protein
MGHPAYALRLLAASEDHELQLRACLGAGTQLDVLNVLLANPHASDRSVDWLIAAFDTGTISASAGVLWTVATIDSIAAPNLRAAALRGALHIPTHVLARAHWIDDADLAQLIEHCTSSELVAITDTAARDGYDALDDTTRAALLERWSREDPNDGPIPERLGELTDAVRAAGLPWSDPPESDIGTVGLDNWWAARTPMITLAYLVAARDTLQHRSCDGRLALTVLAALCDTPVRTRYPAVLDEAIAAHCAAHPDGDAAVVGALSAIVDDDGNGPSELIRTLALTRGDPFIAQLGCGTVRTLLGARPADHELHYAVADTIANRCGDATEPAVAVLAGGFAGTIAELCDVVEVGQHWNAAAAAGRSAMYGTS